jgi:hypothetical protein
MMGNKRVDTPSNAEADKFLHGKEMEPMARGEFKLIIGNMFGNPTDRPPDLASPRP